MEASLIFMSSQKSLLTAKQQEELNLAVLDYLFNSGFQNAFKSLEEELSVSYVSDGKQKYSGLLEKKWLSVLRLQKKIMELEGKNSQLQEELNSAPTRKSNAPSDSIPRPPEKCTLNGHRGPITCISFHPIFDILASASEDSTVKIWDSESGDLEKTLRGHTKSVQSIDFDSKGTYMVSCSSDMSVKIWDTQNEYSCIKTLFGHDHSISSVKFIGEGEFFVSSSRDKTIKIWETSSGFCNRTLIGHSDWVRCVAVDGSSKLLLSGSNDQSVRIWDLSSFECKSTMTGHDHVVECVMFVPINSNKYIRELLGISSTSEGNSPSYVISGSRDKTLKLWDASTGQNVHTFSGHDNWIRGVAFNSSGKFLISVSDDRMIKIWDLSSGYCYKTIEAHSHFVTCISSSPSSHLVATGSVDQQVKLWESR